MKNLSLGATGFWASRTLGNENWRIVAQAKDGIETRNTARNLIFLFLDGGPSHVDTFDMKTGSYTPSSLGAGRLGNGWMWPSSIMPELATMTDQFTLLRSITAVEQVHERATYHMLTSHRQNAAAMVDVPHFSSVLSYFFEADRQPSDSLPTAIWIGPNPAKNGLFPIEHLGLQLSQNGRVNNLVHEHRGLDDRLAFMDRLQAAGHPNQDARADMVEFQIQARAMMADPTLNSLIQAGDDTGGGYRGGNLMGQAEMAVRVLEADRGTRVIQLQSGGWDHHNQIYNQLPQLARSLDAALAYLIRELGARPARARTSGSMLDETLIVAVGEFGRTTGRLNNASGRDHFPYVVPALIAGGGTVTNVAIGSTSSDGSTIVDPGWSHNRYMTISDLYASIYSALGVDYSTKFQDTPSGRLFELTPSEAFGEVNEIDTLFA